MEDLAGDVRQAEVAAAVAASELLVVDAEEVEDRRLQIVRVDGSSQRTPWTVSSSAAGENIEKEMAPPTRPANFRAGP